MGGVQTRENISETPLHTVSRKHVVQPGNRSKTLGLNVPQVSGQRDAGKCSAVQLVTVTAGLFFNYMCSPLDWTEAVFGKDAGLICIVQEEAK